MLTKSVLEEIASNINKNCSIKCSGRCRICKTICCFSPGQYYMVKDCIWTKGCQNLEVEEKRMMICVDCFETGLGEEITGDHLTLCPVNIEFVIDRNTLFPNRNPLKFPKGFTEQLPPFTRQLDVQQLKRFGFPT